MTETNCFSSCRRRASLLPLESQLANIRLGPWMHVVSEVTHFGVVSDGERVSTRGRIAKLFERKGHRFAELDLLLVADDTRPVQHVRHTAIYEIGARG